MIVILNKDVKVAFPLMRECKKTGPGMKPEPVFSISP